MDPSLDADERIDRRPPFPAYGPVDAVLGYVVFYVFVERATPTVVDVVTAVLPDVSASLVRLGLAAALWFVLGATALDQVRRQLAALGVGNRADVARAERSSTLSGFGVVWYLAVVAVGGAVASVTFERAVETGVSLVRVVPSGVVAVSLFDVVAMVVFFVAFGAATRALDRLVVGAIRSVLTG